MYHQNGVGKIDFDNDFEQQSSLIPHPGADDCCAICQRTAKDYYQHWACSKVFAICQNCYNSLRMIQCASCKGVGTSADILLNKKVSANVRLCPACQEKLLGTRSLKSLAAV
jgi:hypothetical protein